MRTYKKIIVHCSDSDFGDVDEIRRWHIERGFSDIGYQAVITNGYQKAHSEYDPQFDGLVQQGRPMKIPGAHCRGHNENSIGVCLIGRHLFSARQLDELWKYISRCRMGYGPLGVFGHNYFNPNKTCPNIPPLIIHKLSFGKI